MAPSVLALVLTSLCGLPNQINAVNFLRAGQVTEKDASDILVSEIEGRIAAGRIDYFQQKLRLTFTSLPKNAFGNLGHQAVRYVLHRYFVQQHGWYVRGLEPDGRKEQSPTEVAEWVPSYLQNELEKRLGSKGASLHDLAILAASLEDVVRREAAGRLEAAYSVHEESTKARISGDSLKQVMQTFFVAYLCQGNISFADLEDVERKEAIFAKKYTGWNEAANWLDQLENKVLDNAPGGDSSYAFETATDVAAVVGAEYFAFNDLECSSLKSTLREMEGNRAGRVRLSTFYKKSLYSHWQFSEKADYLRVLGALDESDPAQPSVILPNYLMARTNCLEASNLYAICCRNECEDLMGHLEENIGMEKADPRRILELVANLPSDTVTVPRALPDALVDRLLQVAEFHHGKVPLHSRLFAQWMHHAYPRECPYPHEAGTTSPLTPDEWMLETGQDESTLSEDEIKQHVENDTCAIDSPHNCDEGTELPWSDSEELFGLKHTPRALLDDVSDVTPLPLGSSSQKAAALLAIGFVALLGLEHLSASSGVAKKQDDEGTSVPKKRSDFQSLVSFLAALNAAHALGFLQATMFAFALALGVVGVIAQRVVKSRKRLSPKCLPF